MLHFLTLTLHLLKATNKYILLSWYIELSVTRILTLNVHNFYGCFFFGMLYSEEPAQWCIYENIQNIQILSRPNKTLKLLKVLLLVISLLSRIKLRNFPFENWEFHVQKRSPPSNRGSNYNSFQSSIFWLNCCNLWLLLDAFTSCNYFADQWDLLYSTLVLFIHHKLI